MHIMRFSEKVMILMGQAGETQMSLGAALDVSQTTVGRWMNGAKPRPKVIARISAHFGIPVETLLDDNAVLKIQNQQDISQTNLSGSGALVGKQLAEKWRSLPKDERVKITDTIIDCLSKNVLLD
jgi:transcriptional regulator with XRE-family HTH domain